jgi:thiamine biosynthesis lipoprotein
MPRPSRITVYVLGAWLCGVGWRSAVAADDFAFYYENVMGTSLELLVRADDAEAARRAEGRVLREIDRLSAIFSGHDATSEFRRWQAAQGPMTVSPELFEVLRACDHWRAESGGAFDPRVQVLTRLWSECAAQGRTPTPEERGAAKALMGRPAWRLDPGSGTAEHLTDCPLSLDAIAKGDIIERACAVALEEGRGVRGLLLNVGGDLRVCGDTARTIAIVAPWADSETGEPLAYVEVRGKAVATSGSSQRGLRIGGRWYSHIFDPRAGVPVEGTAGATVIAERSADADALATIFNVLAPEDSVRLAESLPGVECLIVATDGRVARSAGWHRYERARPAALALAVQAPPAAKADEGGAAAPAGAPWGDEFELLVNFEINRPDAGAGPYRRPYVAVWVEDQNGFPVRTLLLWVSFGGAGPFQWLPDLKRWYRSDEARYRVDRTNLIRTVARPTRPPGQYSILWDGKDNQGKPLGRGPYTLCIDAAREHGTYQGIRTPVTLASEPFAEELQGNVEIKSASVAYRRKGPAQ